MFKLENTTKKLKTTLLVLGVTSVFASSLLANGVSVDGAVKYPTKDGKYGPYHVNTQDVKYNSGRTATKNEINIWNVDVKPDLVDLPKYDTKHGKPIIEDGEPKIAEGSVEWGEELYDKNCGMCHGEFGAGGKGYPTLSGGKTADLVIQRLNPADKSPNTNVALKTVGSYWPYASTLFWYIKDSMPFTAPKTLTNSEVYAITAFLLSVNEIKVDGKVIDEEFVLSKENFNKIVMPNVDGFYPEVNTKDPQQGVKNMTALLSDPKIYGTGTRCMKDCIKGDVKELLMRIKVDLAPNANQPITAERSWKEPVSENTGGDPVVSGNYDTYCSACHSNKAIGAPVLGDKATWSEVMSKGIDTVYENGINGINAMPPKGGTVLSDDEFKQIVDYMINSSK